MALNTWSCDCLLNEVIMYYEINYNYFKSTWKYWYNGKCFNTVFKKYWTHTDRLSIFFIFVRKRRSRHFFDREFSGHCTPKFFVAHGLQTLKIEGMKPIESHSGFWKNMDKVFPTGHQEQSIGLVPQSLLETCCKMDWFWLIFRLLEVYFACYKAIATYFICLAVWLWIFAVTSQ